MTKAAGKEGGSGDQSKGAALPSRPESKLSKQQQKQQSSRQHKQASEEMAAEAKRKDRGQED